MALGVYQNPATGIFYQGFSPDTSSPYSGISNTAGQQAAQPVQQPSGGGLLTNLPVKGVSNGPIGQFVKTGVDQLGANVGFAPGNSFIGPVQPGVVPTGSSATLGGTSLSSAGVGALQGAGVGGLVAGLTGGNTTAGMIGGGLATGLATLGGLGGPAGLVVGGVVGGVAGKLFGGAKPSNKMQTGAINLTSNTYDDARAAKDSQTGKKYSQENAQARDSLTQQVQKLGEFYKGLGLTPQTDSKLVYFVGSRDGTGYFFEDNATGKQGEWKKFGTGSEGLNNLRTNLIADVSAQYGASEDQIKAAEAAGVFSGGSRTGGRLTLPVPMVAAADSNNRGSFAAVMEKYK